MVIKMNEKRCTSGPMVLPPMVFNNFHAEYGSVLKFICLLETLSPIE